MTKLLSFKKLENMFCNKKIKINSIKKDLLNMNSVDPIINWSPFKSRSSFFTYLKTED